MSLTPAFIARWLSPEVLFRASSALTLILFAAILGFTLFLIVLKTARSSWKEHRNRKMEQFNRKIYEFLDRDSYPDPRAWFGDPGRIDRLILKASILTLSENFAGDWGLRLRTLFEDLGFAEEELRRAGRFGSQSKITAARRLGQMKCGQAVPALQRLLRDPSTEVRLAAARALSDIGALDSLEAIVESLARLSKIAAIEVAVVAARAGKGAVRTLIKMCGHRDRDVQLFAIELLGTVDDPESRGTLLHLYRSGNLEMRIACLKALQRHRQEEDFEVFLARLAKPTLPWQEKSQIARTLGKAGYLKAVPYLKGCLCDHNWWVRRNAGEALAAMGEAGQEALAAALDLPDPYAREMAMQWLDECGYVARAVRSSREPGSPEHRFLERCSLLGFAGVVEENRRWAE